MSDEQMGAAGKLLRIAGLAPAAHVHGLRRDLAKAEARAAELKASLERARAENAALQARLEQARTRDEQQHARDDEKARERAAKFERRMTDAAERLSGRDEDRARRIGELRERMEFTERATQLAREQLMAIDVKLDIVEGAITVLDTRTRAALSAATREHPTREKG